MITKIARKEFADMRRDGRFRWTAAIVFVLLAAAIVLGWKQYSTTKTQRESAQAVSRETWVNQGERNPHSAAHFGVFAFKPPMPLSLVDTGLDAFTGVSVWVEAHNQNPAQFRSAEDATAVGRFGELTAAFVLQLLMPLLIILLTYDAFAGERERGTLRQILSLGVPAKNLALGKTLGIVFGLGILLVPAVILGVVALMVASEKDWFAWSLPRLLAMSAGYLLYFGAFIGVGLTVSASAKSSRMALIVLLGFWMFNCLIVPRVVADLAEQFYQTPTAEEFWAAVHKDLSEGIDGHNSSDKRAEELRNRLLAQYGVNDEKDLPINLNAIRLNAGEEYGNTVFDKHYGEIWRTRRAQENLHNFSGLVAPFMAVRSFSSGMAGTDLAGYRHFTSAVENYRRELNKTLNLYFAENSRTSDGYNYMASRELWDKTPDFVYQPPNTGWVLGHQILPLSLLLVWCFGALAARVWAAKRLEV